jgi:hypothetical protein
MLMSLERNWLRTSCLARNSWYDKSDLKLWYCDNLKNMIKGDFEGVT